VETVIDVKGSELLMALMMSEEWLSVEINLDRTVPEQIFNHDNHRQVIIMINDCVYNTLIDTGASVSFIDTKPLSSV
jgi:hypothetical protein